MNTEHDLKKKQNDFCKSGNQAGSREELAEPIHQEF